MASFVLTPHTGLIFAMFVQTCAFVVFNKVCTSQVSYYTVRALHRAENPPELIEQTQYIMWFLPLLPPILRDLRISWRKASMMIALWVAAQAVWLGTAYQLEFQAKEVYLALWFAGISLFGVSVWVLGEIIEGFVPETQKIKAT